MQATRNWQGSAWLSALLVLGALLVPLSVRAETWPVRLTVQKVKGAELLGHVAGDFRLAVEAPESARLVTFYLDGQPVAYATSQPFTFQFATQDFAQGVHELTAIVRFGDGVAAATNRISLDFRPRKWHLAVRGALFLYSALTIGLCLLGAVGIRQLLRLRPRLILLNR